MGLERFLRGALTCLSSQFRLVSSQQVFRVVRESGTGTGNTSNVANRITCGSELYSTILVRRGRPGAAYRQTVVRRHLCSSSAQPSKEVILFQHDRTSFFRTLTVFCGGQFLFWTYLSHFAYTGLRDTGASSGKKGSEQAETTTGLAGIWSFQMNLGSSAWRYGFTLGCLIIGAGIVGLGVLFCRRSVSQVVLHQGGRMVTVSTQSPLGPGRGRRITVPLSQVACYAHRQESSSFIPLRVKGHKFYYLLDKEGTVNNARLFDMTVGAYRPI